MAMPGPFWQVNLSGESTPERRVSTISWSNLTGWLQLNSKYFAASSIAARPAPAAAQGEHLESTLLTTDKMMSSSYWNETSSSSSCGTQPLPEVLQCQPQHYHCYHQSSQTQQPPEKNLVYERVRTYSGPMNKVVQALDPIGSREVLSPLKSSSSYQNLVWSDRSQELHSPTLKISTCAPNALHITTNSEQELHSPTVKVTSYPQTTIRRYIVQNPEQEPLSPFLRGSHFFPGNNVIYEKTIRKVEKLNMDQECCPQVQCQHHIVQQPQVIHAPHCQQAHASQQVHTLTASDSVSTSSANELCRGDSSHMHEQVIIQDDGPEKLDPKYFGELLADLSRKNTDLYHCLLEHLQRIGGSKQDFESTDESEDIESLIPKELSEFTKQQIRYILQMRGMSEKSLRLVLSTFSNIREELRHLQNDLTSLENDKLRLEKDLVFKETQIKEYEELLASVRANNRQQQQGLQDSNSKCQALEESNLSLRHALSDMEYRLKEMEYCKHNLEQENKNLRMQVSETCTGPMLQAKMDEVGNYYLEMVKNLRTEKDREICKLRTQLNQYQKDVLRREGSCSDFQFKLHELTSLLEEKDSLIKRQSEELSKLRQEIYSSHNQPCSGGGRTTITTKKYRTQYPILGLLYDDYEYIPPGSDTHTVVIEKTEDKWACYVTKINKKSSDFVSLASFIQLISEKCKDVVRYLFVDDVEVKNPKDFNKTY